MATVFPPTSARSWSCNSRHAAYGRTSPGNPSKDASSMRCAIATGLPSRRFFVLLPRDGKPVGRQQHEEAARPHPPDAEDAGRGGIDAVEVVQQPAVGAKFAEQLTQGGKIEVFEEGGAHWCRGSGPAARHSHPAAPRARHATWSIAPS